MPWEYSMCQLTSKVNIFPAVLHQNSDTPTNVTEGQRRGCHLVQNPTLCYMSPTPTVTARAEWLVNLDRKVKRPVKSQRHQKSNSITVVNRHFIHSNCE